MQIRLSSHVRLIGCEPVDLSTLTRRAVLVSKNTYRQLWAPEVNIFCPLTIQSSP